MTDPLNIYFGGDFSIWLLCYRIEFSCLDIPLGHFFISTLWLCEVQVNMFCFILSARLPLTSDSRFLTLYHLASASTVRSLSSINVMDFLNKSPEITKKWCTLYYQKTLAFYNNMVLNMTSVSKTWRHATIRNKISLQSMYTG